MWIRKEEYSKEEDKGRDEREWERSGRKNELTLEREVDGEIKKRRETK